MSLAYYLFFNGYIWLFQDAIAGITVGMLIVPQGIAYAKIANLDPQYAVVSLLVGQAISKVTEQHPDISGPEVAACLSLFAGMVTLVIGLIRIGILVDFISEPAIAGYMTGSAITISLGQWPKVFGIHVNTHQAPYLIVYEFFKHLNETKLDAAFGLTALAVLYAIKLGGVRLSNRVPALKKALFFLGIMRSGLVVIIGTLISYFINVHRKSNPMISIIEQVPAGFDAIGAASLNMTVLKEASGVLPSIILIMILEHVSVAKSFGRMSNYVIDPNQEILAIGISNIVGSFFGAYPCTGAFSRTAVMARSGAKTPMAGVFSGAVVVLALYVLTPAFYYIPESVLGSVVIHAVIDLVSGPKFMKELWRSSILEFFIFVIAVVVTCFIDVETGIYASVGLSLLLMLLRLARPTVSSLGRVKLNSKRTYTSSNNPSKQGYLAGSTTSTTNALKDIYGMNKQDRYIYVEETDSHYTRLMDPLPPGVVVIRLSSSILYPNANYVSECITDIVRSRTQTGISSTNQEGRTWNHPSSKEDRSHRLVTKPYLDSIVLDFSAVDKLDATAIHILHSIQQAMDQYAAKTVEWHFCHINSIQVRQLLIQAGFGTIGGAESQSSGLKILNKTDEEVPSYGISDRPMQTMNSLRDPMITIDDNFYSSYTAPKDCEYQSIITLLPSDKYPAFHWDVEAAVFSISQRRQSEEVRGPSSITATAY
ncbi:hypothetical protein HPULCUR_009031 [Helicostylum pulchrum]|uniref:STAS domain-containing protein n=1 Tax=Helicostylum pulchrum TaxID=562976 RepID=A0ABP9Y9A0_9FUNG